MRSFVACRVPIARARALPFVIRMTELLGQVVILHDVCIHLRAPFLVRFRHVRKRGCCADVAVRRVAVLLCWGVGRSRALLRVAAVVVIRCACPAALRIYLCKCRFDPFRDALRWGASAIC